MNIHKKEPGPYCLGSWKKLNVHIHVYVKDNGLKPIPYSRKFSAQTFVHLSKNPTELSSYARARATRPSIHEYVPTIKCKPST